MLRHFNLNAIYWNSNLTILDELFTGIISLRFFGIAYQCGFEFIAYSDLVEFIMFVVVIAYNNVPCRPCTIRVCEFGCLR